MTSCAFSFYRLETEAGSEGTPGIVSCRGSRHRGRNSPHILSLHPPHSLSAIHTHKCFFVLIWPWEKQHYEVLQFGAYTQTQEGSWSCRWNICNAGKGDQASSESVNHCSPWSCLNHDLIPYTCSCLQSLSAPKGNFQSDVCRNSQINLIFGRRQVDLSERFFCLCLFLPSELPFIAHLLVLEDNTLLTLREASVNKVCCTDCKAIWTFCWKGWTWF